VLWAYDYEGERIRVTGATKEFIRGDSLGFHFCPDCGCLVWWRALESGADGKRRMAVNLRMTEPGPIAAVPIRHLDGLDSWQDLPRDGRCVRDMWF
jgi:hypothetical protein